MRPKRLSEEFCELNVPYYPQNVESFGCFGKKQQGKKRELMAQPCMQRHCYALTLQNKHGGRRKKQQLQLIAETTNIMLSLSRLNQTTLWFVVRNVQETKRFPL